MENRTASMALKFFPICLGSETYVEEDDLSESVIIFTSNGVKVWAGITRYFAEKQGPFLYT